MLVRKQPGRFRRQRPLSGKRGFFASNTGVSACATLPQKASGIGEMAQGHEGVTCVTYFPLLRVAPLPLARAIAIGATQPPHLTGKARP